MTANPIASPLRACATFALSCLLTALPPVDASPHLLLRGQRALGDRPMCADEPFQCGGLAGFECVCACPPVDGGGAVSVANPPASPGVPGELCDRPAKNCPVAGCVAPPKGCEYKMDHYVYDSLGECCPALCYAVDAEGDECAQTRRTREGTTDVSIASAEGPEPICADDPTDDCDPDDGGADCMGFCTCPEPPPGTEDPPAPIDVHPFQCPEGETCRAWNDGCNQCQAGEVGPVCTQRYCSCYDDGSCVPSCTDNENCVPAKEKPMPEPLPGPDGPPAAPFDCPEGTFCTEWFDGCNSCSSSPGGSAAVCTQKYCDCYDDGSCVPECRDNRECTPIVAEGPPPPPPKLPGVPASPFTCPEGESCTQWSDGCNSCSAPPDGGPGAVCTERYCECYDDDSCIPECKDNEDCYPTIIASGGLEGGGGMPSPLPGASDCASIPGCAECVDGGCAWTTGECMDDCNVMDVACYTKEYFEGQTASQICRAEAIANADDDACSKDSCAECVATALPSDANDTCTWFELGYCGSGCDANGCGSYECAADPIAPDGSGAADVGEVDAGDEMNATAKAEGDATASPAAAPAVGAPGDESATTAPSAAPTEEEDEEDSAGGRAAFSGAAVALWLAAGLMV